MIDAGNSYLTAEGADADCRYVRPYGKVYLKIGGKALHAI